MQRLDSKIFILMLLIIIEVMGIGIVFPMLPELFIAQSSPLLAVTTTTTLRHICYGVSIALWPLGMFFGTPFLGEISDKIGRKKIFLICLLMTALSYSFLACSVYLHNISLFFASRLLSGFFAGSYEIAQAAAADISTPETKARNMGWIICAMSIGFIIGPLITSVTSDGSSIFSFGITTPFWIACCLSIVNAGLIQGAFQETFAPRHKQQPLIFRKIFSSFLFVLVDPRLRYLSMVTFLLTAAWMCFFTTLPLFLANVFHFEVSTIALFYGLIGASNMLTILFLQKHVLNWFALKKIIIYAAVISGVLFLGLSITSQVLAFIVLLVIAVTIELLAYSSFLAFISNAVTAEEQGKTMGGVGAVSSMAFVGTGLLVALLADVNVRLPIILSGLMFVVIGIMLLKFKAHHCAAE